MAIVIGVALGAALIASRELFGGRPLAFWLENVGGPLLIGSFVAGVFARRYLLGVVAGIITMALAVFLYDQVYLATADTFAITLSGFLRTYWLVLAVPFGALFGALGGWWMSNRRAHWVALALAGGAVAAEAAALLGGGLPHPMFRPSMAVGQIVIGLGAVLAASHPGTRLKAIGVATAVVLAIVSVEVATGVVTNFVW